MCAETIRLANGGELTGQLIEHVGAGCVIIRVDGRNYFGIKADTARRRDDTQAVSVDAAR